MLKTIIIILITSLSINIQASDLDTINKNLSVFDQITSISVLNEALNTQNLLDGYDFSGIVRLSNCSASLVKLKNTNYKNGLILTNGHCMRRFPKPGTVVIDKPSRLRATLLDEDADRVTTLNATRIAYATMTRTDMALIEVKQTYEEIKDKYGIEPLILSEEAPDVGDNIEIISGYWRRGFSCAVDNIVHLLKEGGWDFYDSIGYTKACKVYGGTSGSPVLSVSTGEVVGVNNTGNESGRECTMNNPCEVDENGKVVVYKDKGYAQNTFWIYNCLDESSPDKLKFDFSRSDCKLLGPDGE